MTHECTTPECDYECQEARRATLPRKFCCCHPDAVTACYECAARGYTTPNPDRPTGKADRRGLHHR